MTTLRPATPADIPLIIELARELAVHEKDDHLFTAAPEFYKAYLFTPPAKAECWLIEDEGTIVGMGFLFITWFTYGAKPQMNLQDFIVRASARRKGYGDAFFIHMKKRARELGCAKIKWSAYSWNESAMNFYRKQQAQEQKNVTHFFLDVTE